MTLEQAIASYEKSAERYHKSFLHCKAHGGEFYQSEAESNKICYEHDRQLAAWLRELSERRKMPEIITCGECEHYKALTTIQGDKYFYCKKAVMTHPKPDIDFCSKAERRTNE